MTFSNAGLAAGFKIVVSREASPATKGTLTFFVDGDEKLKTSCWWKADVRIPAKTYTGCSTTKMATKNYKAVYLPDSQTGRSGIFIHQGAGPQHSDGCIVCSRAVVEKIYERVPRDMKQLTVVVVDK